MDNRLFTIDYLIINLSGKLQKIFDTTSNYEKINQFTFEKHDRGTQIFAGKYDVFCGDTRFGLLLSNPHKGSVLDPDFAQFQFDNALFYTKSLPELRQMLTDFTDATDYSFTAINRLDIAMDRVDDDGYYKQLAKDLHNGTVKLAGRKKKITFHNESEKGEIDTTGITVGMRKASRMLRIYNKSLHLRDTPKEYINDWHKSHGLEGQIWRYEYQLNARFFDDMHNEVDVSRYSKRNPDVKCDEFVNEKLTWGVFNYENMIELLRLAEKNHFELRENTGKSQTNKEKSIIVNAWDKIKSACKTLCHTIKKIPKIIDRSPVVKKRLAKSLFREYYVDTQNISYVFALNELLEQLDEKGEKLKYWFYKKANYYLAEFHKKERIKDTFNAALFWGEHRKLFV